MESFFGPYFQKHRSFYCDWLNNPVKEAADYKVPLIEMFPIVKILRHEKIQTARWLPAPLATNLAFRTLNSYTTRWR